MSLYVNQILPILFFNTVATGAPSLNINCPSSLPQIGVVSVAINDVPESLLGAPTLVKSVPPWLSERLPIIV